VAVEEAEGKCGCVALLLKSLFALVIVDAGLLIESVGP
jgi:hypothetical protein